MAKAQNMQPPEVSFVDASPTKRFFISVLIRDIEFLDALVELIDNSVDAVRANHQGKAIKNGWIKVTFGPQAITVSDNGEGISISQAKMNAFRFGRSISSKVNKGSVGAFGVGMKRAMFKLGQEFEVSSTTSTEQFEVKVDVAKWERTEEKTDEWRFPMQVERTGLREKVTGTHVLVQKLHEYSLEEVGSGTFGVRLRDRLQSAHETVLSQGLKITLNGVPLEASEPTLLRSTKLQPIHLQENFKVNGSDISVNLYAGVSDERLIDAGWYVFCNGRQIEQAEKTRRTGWDSALDEDSRTPRPHWQFRRFRGYIFFDSANSQVLPWNTMKTGLNIESSAYRRVWHQLTMALRDVITFLNAVDAEEDNDGPLHKCIEASKPVQLKRLPINPAFRYPSGKGDSASLTTISFREDSELVARVKDELGVSKNYQVGEEVFNFYVKAKRLL